MGRTARESHDAANNKVINVLLAKFSAKYLSGMKKLKKDREELLAFYNFSSDHFVRQ
ncbi:MAG: hypothetical protein ACTS73_08925 [Arsenophonus sp. NEOnobi-MAG3]